MSASNDRWGKGRMWVEWVGGVNRGILLSVHHTELVGKGWKGVEMSE